MSERTLVETVAYVGRSSRKIGASELGRSLLRRLSPMIERFRGQHSELAVLLEVVEIIYQEVAEAQK